TTNSADAIIIPEAIAVIFFNRFWSLNGDPLIGIIPKAKPITSVMAAIVNAVCMGTPAIY
ncbi:MAG: hypothetical protein VW438_04445, partial [Euryarchaeota archaeon]